MKPLILSSDQETFIPCDSCKAQKPQARAQALCAGCRHNLRAISFLRQEVKGLRARQRPVPTLAPVAEIPTPQVRLRARACPHETVAFLAQYGFVCLACGLATSADAQAVGITYFPVYTTTIPPAQEPSR